MGHQFTSILLAQQVAHHHGAALRLDRSYSEWSHHSNRGYHWFEDFFNISDILLDEEREQVTTVRVRKMNLVAKVLNNSACNVLVVVHSGNSDFCSDWCSTKQPFWGVSPFAQFRLDWRDRHTRSISYQSNQQYSFDHVEHRWDEVVLRVAWHVRNGDLKLHFSDGYYSAIWDVLSENTPKEVIMQHTVHAEKPDLPNHFRNKPISKVIGADSFHTTVAMANSHVLVASGSSFTHIAGMAADIDQVYIMGPAKGKESPSFYHFSSIKVDKSGRMDNEAKIALKRKLDILSQRFKG